MKLYRDYNSGDKTLIGFINAPAWSINSFGCEHDYEFQDLPAGTYAVEASYDFGQTTWGCWIAYKAVPSAWRVIEQEGSRQARVSPGLEVTGGQYRTGNDFTLGNAC